MRKYFLKNLIYSGLDICDNINEAWINSRYKAEHDFVMFNLLEYL